MKSRNSIFTGLLLAMCLSLAAGAVQASGYSASNGKLYDPAGQELQVRGISAFGFNSTILQPQYLWEMGWKAQIDQIKALGFNAVRLPFVPDTLYNTTPVDKLSYIDAGKNPDLIGKTPLQAMDLWMAYADSVGLYVMLDFHSVSMIRQYPTWFVSDPNDYNLIYNKSAYTQANWIRDLSFVAKRYANLPHFFGIDIYNEPEGAIRWSTGDGNVTNPAYFWKKASEDAGTAVLQANPNLLIFVQGINGNFDGIENSNIPMNWGEDFQPLSYQPSGIPNDKLVLTPHTYGPDVYVKSTFSAANYPANLAQDWETLFGKQYPAHPVVIGEWGGRYGTGPSGQKDVQWQNALVQYLLSKGIHSSFYWCYTPNSGDSGGILDDNLQVRQDKIDLLKKLWGSSTATTGTTTPPPTTPPPTTTTPQPVIKSFSPVSGAAGTVVTLTGSGYTGAARATCGNGLASTLKVINDSSAQLTVASGCASGPLSIYNSTKGATSAGSFSISASNPQQQISSFSPSSGAVGTVITLNGSGFLGSNQAWVGNAHNAVLQVVSDSVAKITVPAGATTGAVAILNPAHAAFTASSFSMTGK